MLYISELFPYILINTVTIHHIIILRHGNAAALVYFFHDMRIEIWSHDDILLLHLFKILHGILEVALVEVMFNQLGKDVAQSDGFFNSLGVNELVTDLHGRCAVVAVERFSGLNEFLDDADSLSHEGQFHFFALAG